MVILILCGLFAFAANVKKRLGLSLSRFGVWLAFTCCFYLCSAPAHAAPWIDVGDEQLRHHIQYLADTGVISSPVTTWPLMWSSIKKDLDETAVSALNESQLWSYRMVKHALRRQTQTFSLSKRSRLASSRAGLSDFSDDARERVEVGLGFEFMGSHIAASIRPNYVDEPLDGRELRLDGSYIAGVMGNWVIGAGAIDRWWGPGWQSSLILSHAARPAPGVFFRRNVAEAFTLPVLRHLGPWQWTMFASQLEGQRHVPEAKLIGMRLSMKPAKLLELGLSRTAQWGGEGRPQSFSNFFDMLVGRDNRGSGGIDLTGANEPGNQLGGIDFRLSLPLARAPSALYAQLIGEDEAGGLPSRHIGMLGGESGFHYLGVHHRLALEYADTTMSFLDSEPRPNRAYEHNIYRSGYRYRGLPLGASTDNDTRSLTLRGDHYLENGHQFSWKLLSAQINRDGSGGESGVGGNIFGGGKIDQTAVKVSYKAPLNGTLRLELEAFHYDSVMKVAGQSVESGVALGLHARI